MTSAGMAWGFALAACFLLGVSVEAGVNESETEKSVFYVSFDRSMFKGLNENDAVAALRIWTTHFIKNQGVDTQVQISSYESRLELDALLASGGTDLIIMNTLRYLKTKQTLRDTISPQFVTTVANGSPYSSYHLITHVDSGITTFEGLAGKDVLLLNTSQSRLTKDWFFQELNQVGLLPEDVNTHVVENVSKALLPVFFKKSDACVVDGDAYELMQEFNPQLGRQLHTVITSPDYAEAVICMRNDYQTDREMVLQGLGEIHADASGRQVMLVFKIRQLIPFQPQYLDTVAELLQQQKDAEAIRGLEAQ
ncbi:phosphate/phosphite/phosphonate ABC transporter substrate-binding protein [Coraliomargarita sp. W4R72]